LVGPIAQKHGGSKNVANIDIASWVDIASQRGLRRTVSDDANLSLIVVFSFY